MQAPRRLVRLVDRLTLLGHPATEALVERGLRASARLAGRATGGVSRLVAPWLPPARLREAFEQGLAASATPPRPRGRVLSFPGR